MPASLTLLGGAALRRQPRTGIALTAAGLSRCVELEAHTVVVPVPSMLAGVGLALSLGLPVKAEACGNGAVGMVEDVDIVVYGRGLAYSTPALAAMLEAEVLRAYNEDEDAAEEPPLPGPELEAAAFTGSVIAVGSLGLPLSLGDEAWAVLVKLRRPLQGLPEAIARRSGDLASLLASSGGDAVDALWGLALVLEEASRGYRRLRPSRLAERLGAAAPPLVDYAGGVLAVVFDDVDAALAADDELEDLGTAVAEAPVVVFTAE